MPGTLNFRPTERCVNEMGLRYNVAVLQVVVTDDGHLEKSLLADFGEAKEIN